MLNVPTGYSAPAHRFQTTSPPQLLGNHPLLNPTGTRISSRMQSRPMDESQNVPASIRREVLDDHEDAIGQRDPKTSPRPALSSARTQTSSSIPVRTATPAQDSSVDSRTPEGSLGD